MKPVFKELAKSNKSIQFVHVDVDSARDTMANELVHISTLPTFQLFKNGQLVQTFSEANANKLKSSLELFRAESNQTEANKTEKPKPKTSQRGKHKAAESTKAQTQTHGLEEKSTHEKKEEIAADENVIKIDKRNERSNQDDNDDETTTTRHEQEADEKNHLNKDESI